MIVIKPLENQKKEKKKARVAAAPDWQGSLPGWHP